MLALAAAIAGRRVAILDLFRDETLLGQVLVSDRFADGRMCSKSTMAHRRTEARSLATILKPELRTYLGRDPHDVIRDALRTFAERRGGGYRITGGTPRSRGGPTPTKPELQGIVSAIGQGTGWVGLRDRAIAALLAGTASRVTAMLTLDGADCHVLPGDRVRLLLHQKNGRERHEVELDQASATALRLYVAAYNDAMQCAGRQHRITLGAPGSIWRTERGTRMPAQSFRDALKRACEMAGTRNYTPHAFRRAWATSASEVLPRWEGALGGGWHGTERFDASYVTPTRTAAWQKLGGLGVPALDRVAQNQAGLESARAV
jgi:integrase